MLAEAPNLTTIQSNTQLKYLSFNSVGELISNSLPFIFGAAGIALLIYLVFGGFQLMLSRGDPKAIEGARGKITNALIGFVIVVAAYLLTQLAGQLLNLGGTSFGQVFNTR